MEIAEKTVGPLDKVKLKIEALSTSGAASSASPSHETEIIYGIGCAGVTPFEKAIFGKPTGAELTVGIEKGQHDEYFGHLKCSVAHLLQITTPCELHITVQSIRRADSHEVVKAMAQMTGCGGGCNCGCDCG